MQMITIFVGVVGGFKALEWIYNKITSAHDKSQKIDENDSNFQEYKKGNDEKIKEIERQLKEAHKYASDSLDGIKKEILTTINTDRDEYLKGIDEVKQSITEMSSAYQQTAALIDLRIQTLSDRVEKHNSVIERTYALEKQVGILENRESVSEHRLSDIERSAQGTH